MTIEERLNQYAEYKAQLDALRLAAEERRAEILKTGSPQRHARAVQRMQLRLDGV